MVLHTKYSLFVGWFSTYFRSTPCWRSKKIIHPILSCLSYDFSLNYGEIWAQSNDNLGVVFAWMYLKNCWRKWSLFVFSILFCIFSTTVLKKSQTTLCYDVGPLTSLWNSRNPCWKSEWILFCNVLKSFWLVSGPWRNWWPVLSTILQTFCYLITILSFCLLLSQQTRDCTIFLQQFIIVNQPSYPSLAGLTVDWLEYKNFVTSWDIGFQVIVPPLVSDTTTLVGHK